MGDLTVCEDHNFLFIILHLIPLFNEACFCTLFAVSGVLTVQLQVIWIVAAKVRPITTAQGNYRNNKKTHFTKHQVEEKKMFVAFVFIACVWSCFFSACGSIMNADCRSLMGDAISNMTTYQHE